MCVHMCMQTSLRFLKFMPPSLFIVELGEISLTFQEAQRKHLKLECHCKCNQDQLLCVARSDNYSGYNQYYIICLLSV